MKDRIGSLGRGLCSAALAMIGLLSIGAHAPAQVVVTLGTRTLTAGQGVQGWNNQTVCASGAEASFGVVFGAAPGVGGNETAWGTFRITRNEVGADEPEWMVHSGYAAARGWRPRIRSSIVNMVPEACDVILEIDRVNNVHRVYMHKGEKPARVFIDGDTRQHVLTEGQFLEVDAGSRKLRRGPMPYDAAAAVFAEQATSQPRFTQLGEKGCAPPETP